MKKRAEGDQFVTDDDWVRLDDGTVKTIKELRAHYLNLDDYTRQMKMLALEELALKGEKDVLLLHEQLLKPFAELHKRMALLCELYGIRTPALGFRRKLKPGRKELLARDVMLILDVEYLKTDRPDLTDSAAIRRLVTAHKFSKRWQGAHKRTLESALIKARKDKRVVDMIARLRELAREKGLDLWEMLDEGYQYRLGTVSRK